MCSIIYQTEISIYLHTSQILHTAVSISFSHQKMSKTQIVLYFDDRAVMFNNHVPLATVKPRVRLLQNTLPHSGGAKVTCLATGFYPRHINLTLLRDGQPVSDHQISCYLMEMEPTRWGRAWRSAQRNYRVITTPAQLSISAWTTNLTLHWVILRTDVIVWAFSIFYLRQLSYLV